MYLNARMPYKYTEFLSLAVISGFQTFTPVSAWAVISLGPALCLHLHSECNISEIICLNVNFVVVTCDFSMKAVSQLVFGEVWSLGGFCSVLIQERIAWIS